MSRTKTLSTWSLLLALWACASTSEPAGPCETAECVATWAVERWPEEREAVTERLRGLGTDTERLVAVMTVVEAHPGTSASLCSLLPRGPVSRRCDNISHRPHLWTVSDAPGPENDAFNGEAERTFDLDVANPFVGLPPLEGDCEGRPRTTCLADQALDAALAGEVSDAGRACMAVEDDKWRSECFFDVAEQLCGPKRSQLCGVAARLCLGAARYRIPCFVEVAGEISKLAPAAGSGDAEAWRALRGAIDQAERLLSKDSPELARRFADRTWAEAIRRAYQGAPAVGTPMDHVPEQVHPHVRATLAKLLLRDGEARSLAAWGQALAEAEARRSAEGLPEPSPAAIARSGGRWSVTLPQEERLQARSYLGDARRAVHADIELDRLICVLEAAARRTPAAVELLAEGATHPDRLVRWTAVRLLASAEPSHVALHEALSDPEPLVRERAALARQDKGG